MNKLLLTGFLVTASASNALAGTPGATQKDAIEVCQIAETYLNRLRCSDGKAPTHKRLGNVGPRERPKPGEPEPPLEEMLAAGPIKPGMSDWHIVDKWALSCSKAKPVFVFVDMYHCNPPPPAVDAAPTGMSIIAADASPEIAANRAATADALISARVKANDIDGALLAAQEAQHFAESASGTESWESAEATVMVAYLTLVRSGPHSPPATVEQQLKHSIAIFEKNAGPTHERIRQSLYFLGHYYAVSGDSAKAGIALRRALALAKQSEPPNDGFVETIMREIAELPPSSPASVKP